MSGKLTFLILAVVLSLFVLPFFWFEKGELLLGGEAYTALDYKLLFTRNLFFWNSSYGFGLPNITIIPQLYHFFLYFFSFFIPPYFLQKISLGLILSLSFVSSFYLLRYFFSSKNNGAVLIGSLFYVFNPFFVSMFGWVPTYGFLFIFTPLVLLQAIKIFEGKANSFVYSLLFFFGFCYAGVGMNLALYSFAYWLIMLCAIRAFFVQRNRIKVLRRLITIFGVLFLSNAYWLLPFAKTYKNIFGGASVYGFNFSDISLYKLPIFNSFTLNEYYWFTRRTMEGDYFYPFSRWYEMPSQAFVLVIVLFVMYVVMITINKSHSKYTLFFIVLFVIGVFLTKGTAPPLGDLYKFLLKFVKFFGIYRSSDIKFPYLVILSLSYLIPYALISISTKKIFQKRVFYLYGFIVCGILLLGLPFITGGVLPSRQPTINSLKVTIPNYWNDAMDYLNKEIDGRIIVFPRNYSPLDNYVWGYKGVYLPYLYSDASIVGYTIGYGSSLEESRFNTANIVYSLYEKNKIGEMMSAASLFNIRYFIQRSDFDLKQNAFDVDQKIDSTYANSTVLERFDSVLKGGKGFGHITLYRVPDEYFLKKIYVPSKLVYLKGDRLVELEKAITNGVNPKDTALFFEDQVNFSKKELLQEQYSGIIDFKKISATKYKVEVETNSAVVPIVFSESFSNGWRVESKTIKKVALQTINNSHSMVNGYANAWVINVGELCKAGQCLEKNSGKKGVSFTISYAPQKQFVLGALITTIGLLGSVIIIGINLVKIILNRYEK